MAFRIKRHERVRDAVARIVREELADARAEAEDRRSSLDERIHAVRARVKRARATLRLARGGEGPGARPLDRRLRALARDVAGARDAAVTAGVLGALAAELPEHVRLPAAPEAHARRDLRVAVRELRRLRPRAMRWRAEADGRSARRAFVKTFREARRRRARLRPESPAAAFHRWRKSVKRLGLQLRLLSRVVPELDRYLDGSIGPLAELLGEIHDLALARARLERARATPARAKDVRAALDRLEARDRAARGEALSVGSRVFAPRPRFVRASLRAGWRTWRPSRRAS